MNHSKNKDKKYNKGLLKVVGAKNVGGLDKNAVWARVVVEDENGKLWSFKASTFHFDLEPYQEEVPKQST